MHTLTKNFADQLALKIQKDDLIEFGRALQYGNFTLKRRWIMANLLLLRNILMGTL